jgi:hypothetical protein
MSADQSSAAQTLLSLASKTMAQLRELARLSGLGSGYSAMSRSQLLESLQQRMAGSTKPAPSMGIGVAAAAGATVSAPSLEPASELAGSELSSSRLSSSEPASLVNFLPRDPQWASVFWQLSAADRQRAGEAGAQQLCLRVADVTGLPEGATHPHTLQEVVVDAGATTWFLPVPLCDRDYRVELGYRLAAGRWLSLAFSAVARVPADAPAQAMVPGYAPFSIEPIAPLPVALPAQASTGGVDHERFYQRAMAASPRRLRVGSEDFHDQALVREGRNLGQSSGAGVWASGLSESGAGLARPRSFWLVADAELIVYGATEPSATLTIGERQVPLEADGCFHLHVPFADGEQLYPIRAVAADGDQQRSIRIDVQRQTPEARVNSREAAQLEWF